MTLARLFVAIGGVFVLALFAALIGPYFIDWTSYRADFEREASRILGQKVEVLGAAKARLLPFPSVTFNDVVVRAERPGEPAMMRIARFSMDAELAPFLRGRVLIFDMRIEEPRATVRLRENGTLDWAMRRGSALPASAVVLERVTVSDGLVTIVDEHNDRNHTISNLQADLSAASLSGPWQVEGTGSLDGRTGAFSLRTGTVTPEGGIRLRTRLLPDARPISIELEGEARFEDAEPRYDGQFFVQAFDLSAITGRPPSVVETAAVGRARGRFALSNERLRIDEYRLELGEPSDPYVVTGEATIDTGRTPEFLLLADGQQIDLDRLAADDATNAPTAGRQQRAGGEAAGPAPALSPAERLAVLTQIVRQMPIPQLPGRVSILLPAVLAGDTTARDITIKARPDGSGWRIDEFSARLPGRTQVEAAGRLEVVGDFGFVGDLLVAANQPSGLAAWLTGTVDPAIRTLSGAGISAGVTLRGDLQQFDDLELIMGEAVATGRFVRHAPAGGRPVIDTDLRGGAIDLDAVRALAGLIAEDGEAALAAHDIDASVKVDRFTAFGVAAGGVDARIAWRSGIVLIDGVKIDDLAGAKLALDGEMTGLPTAPRGELKLHVDAPKAEPLVSTLSRIVGENPVADHLAGRASLFDDTVLSAEARFDAGRGDAPGLSFEAKGTTGGSALVVRLERPALLAPPMQGAMTLELTAENEAVDELLAQIGLSVLPVEVQGPALLSLRLDGSPRQGMQMGLAFSTADSEIGADGMARLTADRAVIGRWQGRLISEDFEPYLLMAGISLPSFGAGLPIDVSARLEADSETFRAADIDGRAAGNGFAGTLTLSGGQALVVSGDVALDRIDSGWIAQMILGPAGRAPPAERNGNGTAPVEAGSQMALWPDGGFPTAAGLGVTADIRLSAAEADLLGGLKAGQLSAAASLRNGTLDLSGVRADLASGRLEGSMRLANVGGSGLLASQLALRGADLGALLANSPWAGAADAAVDLSLSFEGTGKSPLAMVRSLTGSGALSLFQVSVDRLNADGLQALLRRADAEDFAIEESPVRQLAVKAVSGGTLRFDRFDLPFTIASGIVRADSLLLAKPDATVAGMARLDLARGYLESDLTLTYAAADATLAGAEPTIGLVYEGPVGALRRRIEVGELMNFLSLRAFEQERRKVELLQATVLEKQRMRRELALQRAEDQARLEAERRRAEAEEAARRQEAEAEERQRAAQRAAAAALARQRDDTGGSDPFAPAAHDRPPRATDGVGTADSAAESGPPDQSGRNLLSIPHFDGLPGVRSDTFGN